jgi:hypothetical protein
MKLRVTKLDELPEDLRSKATVLKDGETIIGYEVDAAGLLAKNSELLGEVKQYKEIANKVKGLDVEAARKAITEMATLDQRKAELDGEIQKALLQAKSAHDTEMEKLRGELNTVTSQLDGSLVKETLYGPITAAKGVADFIMPRASQSVKVFVENGKRVAKIVDEKGNPRVDVKTGQPYTADQLIEELKADKVFSRAFESGAGSGSGAAGQSGQGGQGGGSGAFRLTQAQARDTATYQRVRAEAEKAGQSVEIIPG